MRVKLEDVCDSESSNLKQSDVIGLSGVYPVYGATGLLSKANFYHQDKKYVAVVKDGAGIGRAKLLPEKTSVIGTMQYLIPKDNILPEYLYYAVKHMGFGKHHSGSTIPHIYFKDYKKEELNLVDVKKQEEIVLKLDIVSQILEYYKVQISKYDDLIKARFVEMFGTLSKNEKGFDIVKIADVCDLIKDGTHQTPNYTDDNENGYKFLSSKDVMSQKINWKSIKYIPKDLHEKLCTTIKPQRNDILMSKNGVNYGVAAVNDTNEIFDIYVSLALLRPKKIIDPIFLKCVINNPETKKQFDSSIKGIGVPNLHLSEIKKTMIILPPLELQNRFADFVKQVDKSKLAVQQSLEKTQQLFDSLMQEYFG